MARGGRASVRLFALSSASGGSRNRTAADADQREHRGEHGEVDARRDPGAGGERREACPDEAACRERRVEGGEDRAPREPLERQSLGIRGHIDRAEGRPEAEQRSREGRESSRERGGDQGARSEQQARKRHAPAPDALAQAAGKRHRRERAEGGREQRQPEACVRQRGVMLHGRDPTSPGAEHQPVAEEVQPDREAFRAHQASTTSTPRAR